MNVSTSPGWKDHEDNGQRQVQRNVRSELRLQVLALEEAGPHDQAKVQKEVRPPLGQDKHQEEEDLGVWMQGWCTARRSGSEKKSIHDTG